MSKSTKVHHYDHTLRSVTMANAALCNHAMYFYPVPPKEALTIENLELYFKMTIDAGVPAADRVLEYIGIANERPNFYLDQPAELRKLELNLLADPSTRVIEGRYNLSTLLTKDHVGYREYFDDATAGNYTYIVFMLGPAFQGLTASGIMNICKTDATYTTKGIR